LKSRIEDIWERNRGLAKSLGEAVNEIRSQLADIATLNADTAKSVEQALTKVESVQKTLETRYSDANITQNSLSVEEPTIRTKQSNNSTTADGGSASLENDKPPHASFDSSVTNTPGSRSPIESDNGQRNILSPKPVNKARPLRNPARPLLANSEFAWMLGGDRHLSSFVSPASVPPEQSRHGEPQAKQGALFGNGEVEQKKPNPEPDGLAMKSLRGTKGSG
jgi:TBC1 domain family protein 5